MHNGRVPCKLCQIQNLLAPLYTSDHHRWSLGSQWHESSCSLTYETESSYKESEYLFACDDAKLHSQENIQLPLQQVSQSNNDFKTPNQT
jgi:hypothetical protein